MSQVELDIYQIARGLNSTRACKCNSLRLRPHFVPTNLLHMLDSNIKMKMMGNRIAFYIEYDGQRPYDSAMVWIGEFLALGEVVETTGLWTLSLDVEVNRIAAELMFAEDEDFDNVESFLTKAKLEGTVK